MKLDFNKAVSENAKTICAQFIVASNSSTENFNIILIKKNDFPISISIFFQKYSLVNFVKKRISVTTKNCYHRPSVPLMKIKFSAMRKVIEIKPQRPSMNNPLSPLSPRNSRKYTTATNNPRIPFLSWPARV